MVRAKFFARTAMALALSLGVAAGGFNAAQAADKKKEEQKEPQLKLSEKFLKVAKPGFDAMQAAIKRPELLAQRDKVLAAEKKWRDARNPDAKQAAAAEMQAEHAALTGMMVAEKAKVDATVAAAASPDEKLTAGQLLSQYGLVALDRTAQTAGLQMQIDSGKLTPDLVGNAYYQMGMLAMQAADFKTAQVQLKKAVDAGYKKDDVEFQLSKAYMNDGQLPLGLKMLHETIVRNGAATPEFWIDDGVVQAYNAKLFAETNLLAVDLVTYYPTASNWARATMVVAIGNNYKASDKLDMMRLRHRNGTLVEADDYLDYIAYAVSSRQPAEVLRVIDEGIKAGKITPASEVILYEGATTVAKVQASSQAKMAEDNALLSVQERDAVGAKGTGVTATAAGDSYLAHANPAKAEAMYRVALTKPDVDAGRTNLRLGIALYDQGKYAEALAAFNLVTDARAPIAQLWAAQTKLKLAGK